MIEEDAQRRFQEALLKVAEPIPDLDEDSTEEIETLVETPDAPKIQEVHPPSQPENLFQHPDAHPYVLDLFLLKTYGPEWLEWEPETLLIAVSNRFKSNISSLNMQKLQALKTLHFVDTFWQNWEVFAPCVQAFCNVIPDFEVLQVPTVTQCAVAIDIANRLRSDVTWSEELKAFLEVVHKHDGILEAVEPFDFVTIDTDGLDVDVGAVMRQWPSVRANLHAPSDETVEAEQLRRLLIIHQAMLESRSAMNSQLSLLLNV